MRTGCYILLAVTAVCRILTMRKDKALYITVAGPAVALAASMAVHFINPVNDLWFYGAGAVTAAGLAVSLILLVRQCNHLAVHPDPLFSGGKAGQGEGGAA